MASHYTLKESAYSSHSQILESFPPRGEGRTVLDLGCGNAYLGGLLAARGYRVTGVERPGGFDPAVVPPGVRMIAADLEQPLALNERFDFVLCADILEHLRRPEDLLAQIPRWLQPEGRLVASLPNSGNLYFRLNVLAGRFPQDDKGLFDRTHVRFYMWNGWRALLGEAGFAIEETRCSAIPFTLVLPGGGGLLEAANYLAARLWKRLFAYQFIVRCYHRESGIPR